MKGRKKSRAEKYDPDMDLSELRERAWMGKFHGEIAWQFVLEFWGVYEPDWDKITAEDFYGGNSLASPENAILEWCRLLLGRKDISGFRRLTEMMETAAELKNQGLQAVDPLRSAILQGNEVLYEEIFKVTRYKGDVKKADLLKYLRKNHSAIFDGKEDADVFKMMRKMGLPRRPYCYTETNQRVMDAFMKGYKKRWKIKS